MQHKTKYTIAEASDFLGFKSRSTLNSKTKAGIISYETDSAGIKIIDASELARVFPDLYNKAMSNTNDIQPTNNKKTQENTSPGGPDTATVFTLLTQQIELMREDLKQERDQHKEREERLYHEKNELMGIVKNHTLMLTHQPDKKVQKFPFKNIAIISGIIAATIFAMLTALYTLAHFLK